MLAGDVVHKAIRRYILDLNSGRDFREAEAKAYATGLFNAKLEYSAERKYTTDSKSEAGECYCALYEHEYGLDVSANVINENRKLMDSALGQFFTMDIETKQGPMKLLSLLRNAQSRSPEERGYSFEYEGWQINPVFDLLLEFANVDRRIPVVIDWKVEKNFSNDNSQQMHLYGYAVWKRWHSMYGTKPEDITLVEINLLSGRSKRHAFCDDDVVATDDLMFESIREFNYVVGDRKFEDCDIKEFGLTQNTNSCSYCNQRKLCIDSLQQEEKEYAADALKLF